MKKAISYLRVSSDGQAEKYGLDAQDIAVTKFAQPNGFNVVETFKEPISGKNDLEHREALLAASEYLSANPDVNYIIIPALSRLARDLMVQETIIGDFRARGIEVVSVIEPDLCSDDPTRKLIRQVIGAINEYDRAMTVTRLRNGRVVKTSKGGHAIGRLPIGFKTDEKKRIVRVDEEVDVVRLVFRLRDERKLSFRRIADYLNDQTDYKPKNWTEERPTKFYTSTIQKIYKNPKYRGTVSLTENGKLVATGYNENLKIF